MEQLKQLFAQWAGIPCTECLALGANGSSRRYYRLSSSSPKLGEGDRPQGGGGVCSAIGCIADDLRENEAFFAFARHFHAKGLPVPELYLIADDRRHYLQQDLGDQTLYGLLYDKQRQGGGFDAQMLAFYKQALADLAALQRGGADLDFSLAYPRPDFDRQSILWDLNYFKYHFLKLLHIPFDEQLLADDFNSLADYLLTADTNYFMYRDFQGRNIMLVGSGECVVDSSRGQALPTTHYQLPTLYYIDFQGGRRGAAQYDVASLLYSAKSNLPEAIRRHLLGHYLDVRNIRGDERRQWIDHFWAYLLVRILQTLGAYGYRGLFERKDYFLQSIPLAITNLQNLIHDHPLSISLPEINRICRDAACSVSHLQSPTVDALSPLTVTVQSFSYKQGLPTDPTGNGGGFIFDCRALPNPGRYPQYKAYTGKDRPVIEFLQKEPAVDHFLSHAEAIVSQSIEKYLERNFTSLQVSFGCTGGQHRSVYCAEQLTARLSKKYPCNILLRHREQDR